MARVMLWGLLVMLLATPVHADPVMERVNKTNTLRCGYVPYHPGAIKDANTGKLTGYDVEITNEIAQRLQLKVEWVAETNWGLFINDLTTNKFDALCVGAWAKPKLAKFSALTIPTFYEAAYLVVRKDDNRFDKDTAAINNPAIKISVLEGDAPQTLAAALFPKAQLNVLSPETSFTQVYEDVATKRSDITIGALADAMGYIKNNPQKALKVLDGKPVKLYAKPYYVRADAIQLQQALSVAIDDMQRDGTMQSIVSRYTESPNELMLPITGLQPIVPKREK